MFVLNEKVVYPGHGVAYISRIVEKNIGGKQANFYELKFLHKDMMILVPIHSIESAGIRRLSSEDIIEDALRVLTQPARVMQHYEFTASNWNKRNKDYQSKLRTGRLKDLSEIYRDLCYISTQKELSFGEKNLLAQTEALLAEEIAVVKDQGEEMARERLRALSPRIHIISHITTTEA